MKFNLPWIKSRERIIFSILADIISFIIIYISYINIFYKEQTILLYLLKLFLFWITFSYIIGRYHQFWIKKSDYINYLIKTALVSLLSHSILFFLSTILHSQFYLIESGSILKSSFIFSFFLTNTLQILLSLFNGKRIINDREIIFISSSKNRKIIKNLSNFGLKRIKYQIFEGDYFKENKIPNRNNIYVLCEPDNLDENTEKIIKDLQLKGYSIYTLLSWSENFLECLPSSILSNSDLIKGNLKIRKNSLHFRLKRLGDLSFSIFLLLVTSPIIVLIGILIKLQDFGPIFYSQKRTGLNGKEFYIYKLRSMKRNAENNKALWSKDNDPRITFIGRFIRRTRIDELPQLWCVINGSMSLIGPRPERPELEIDLEKTIKYYKLRYSIKPGLSGWAQVKYKYGNSILDSEIKLSYDLYYLRHFSFWLDILIMLKTIRTIIYSNFSK